MPLELGEHAFKTVTGATLSYYVRGKGARVLVAVAPGWGCASVLYQNSFAFLEDAFTFVHLEVRGTRKSSFPDDPSLMSSWHMADDVEALRVHLGVEALDGLLGHSNGGCIATWYAIRYPTRVRKLVLLDSQLLGAEAVAEPATRDILDVFSDQAAVQAYRTYNPGSIKTDEDFGIALDNILPLYFSRPVEYLAHFKANLFTNLPQADCVRMLWPSEAQHADQVQQLTKVQAQTLIIVGKLDFICPVPVSNLLAERIADASLCVMENAGHFPWVEEEKAFCRALYSFYGLGIDE